MVENLNGLVLFLFHFDICLQFFCILRADKRRPWLFTFMIIMGGIGIVWFWLLDDGESFLSHWTLAQLSLQ